MKPMLSHVKILTKLFLINNPTALELAIEYGLNTLKFFPAEASGGVKMIQSC